MTPPHPDYLTRAAAKWIDNNPAKHAAHITVATAIKRGKLNKQPCEVCGSSNVHAHHDDYTKHLEVRWLCPKHHKEAHGIYAKPKPQKKLRPKLNPNWKRVQLLGEALKLRSNGYSYAAIASTLCISVGLAFNIVNNKPCHHKKTG